MALAPEAEEVHAVTARPRGGRAQTSDPQPLGRSLRTARCPPSICSPAATPLPLRVNRLRRNLLHLHLPFFGVVANLTPGSLLGAPRQRECVPIHECWFSRGRARSHRDPDRDLDHEARGVHGAAVHWLVPAEGTRPRARKRPLCGAQKEGCRFSVVTRGRNLPPKNRSRCRPSTRTLTYALD